MPVTFTVLGSSLDINVIDDNMKAWQDVFRSGLVNADFVNRVSRFRVFRYVSGRLESMHLFANPYRNHDSGHTMGVIDHFDLAYRKSTEDPGLVANAFGREANGARNAYAMEMLGRPGPSFHYEWQEQGISQSLVAAAASSGSTFPPANFPYNRYPDDYCYSRWLTVHGASLRTFLKHKAVARVTAHVKGEFDFWGKISRGGTAAATHPSWVRRYSHCRAGIIVDTNPNIRNDFANTNPNVIDPSTGSQASHVSWKVANDQTFVTGQREVIRMCAEVPLLGGSHYNFSLKLREAGHHGWVDHGTNTWKDDVWEWNATDSSTVTDNRPQHSAASGLLPPTKTTHRALFHRLYESSSIDVEFIYGRSTAYLNDSSHAEFS